MTRPKRTEEELRIAILDKICDVGEGVNKTTIANAARINNTLVTSLLSELVKEKLIKRDGQKNFEITNAGRGWLMIEGMGKEAAGLYVFDSLLKPIQTGEGLEPITS